MDARERERESRTHTHAWGPAGLSGLGPVWEAGTVGAPRTPVPSRSMGVGSRQLYVEPWVAAACACMYVCTCVCMHVYLCVYVCARVRACMHAGTCAHVSLCACMCVYTCVWDGYGRCWDEWFTRPQRVRQPDQMPFDDPPVRGDPSIRDTAGVCLRWGCLGNLVLENGVF